MLVTALETVRFWIRYAIEGANEQSGGHWKEGSREGLMLGEENKTVS